MLVKKLIMEASTSHNIRRKSIMNNSVSMSPLRRTINRSGLDTSLLEISNDEDERSVRRSKVEIQKRLSKLPQEKAYLSESYIKEQFIICTHLFTENKINTKNAWKLQIIDMLKPLCQKVNKDTLQVASTSIDISAKVYGIRVDDVHSDGLKLANSMARVSEREKAHNEDDEEDGADNEQESEKRSSTKKKKKRSTGQKTTVTNTIATLGSLPKLEPVDFTTRVNAETGAIDNLFTNVLKEECTNTMFAFLDRTVTLIVDEDPLVKNFQDLSTPLSCLPSLGEIPHIRLNLPFNDFKVDEWDPDQEEQLFSPDKSVHSQNPEVVFDENGLPIPELDGSIPDIFENMDDGDIGSHPGDDHDDDIEFIQQEVAPQLRGELAHIVDFRSVSSNFQTSEYSFNTIVNTDTGNYIDQIWAGPCHWKLKFIRRSTAKFSGARTVVAVKHRKKKVPPQLIEYPDTPPDIDFSKKLVIKKRPPTVDIIKITLPMRCDLNFEETIDDLMLKPGVRPIEKKEVENVDYDVGPYKYENPNDSLYCSQRNSDHGGGDDGILSDHEEQILAEQQNFLGENLVNEPIMVPEACITYALKAKQMDMKKLKSAIWHTLTNNKNTAVDKQSQIRTGKVEPTTFSKIYENLPDVLTEKDKKELSCSLAFVALLHLCNEQNLGLQQFPDYKDFGIKGPDN